MNNQFRFRTHKTIWTAKRCAAAEVTSRIGESNRMERVLPTTVQELGHTLGATRTYIRLAGAAGQTSSSEI